MPIYVYECGSCRHRFDLKQGFDSEPVAVCPACQGEARRRISPVGVIFKGSGWYVNDHGRGRNSASGNGNKAKDSEGSGESREASPKAEGSKAKAEESKAGEQ